MKVTASISYSDSRRSCQVNVEQELSDSVTAETLSAQTWELLKGLQSGIADAISGNRGKAISHTNNPPASANKIPNGNTAPGNPSASSSAPVPGKRKQRPGDQPSPSQRKYLNDLLRANGLDLSRWCQDNNVQENQITVAHCQQWIPKLREMAKDKIFLTPQV